MAGIDDDVAGVVVPFCSFPWSLEVSVPQKSPLADTTSATTSCAKNEI